MEQIFLTAAVLLLPMLCTTAGAAGVFLLRKTGEPATRRMLCGMAAGIMLAASVWSLLLPAIERAEQGPLPAWVPPAVGLLLGAVGLLRLETLAGRLLNAGPGRCGRMELPETDSCSGRVSLRPRPGLLQVRYHHRDQPGVPT